MILYHATPNWNATGCEEQGILCAYARGKRRVVWLHSANYTYWARHHVAYRHGCSPAQVVVLRVSVPRGQLRRGPARGLWYSVENVDAGSILGKEVSALAGKR